MSNFAWQAPFDRAFLRRIRPEPPFPEAKDNTSGMVVQDHLFVVSVWNGLGPLDFASRSGA